MKNIPKKKENKVNAQELFFQADKLSIIHRNIEKFLDKIFKETQIRLETPQQFKKHEDFLNISQWTIRFAAAGGGVAGTVLQPDGHSVT